MKSIKKLIDHIIAMESDNYLQGHPEWEEIVQDAKDAGEYLSSFNISSNEPQPNCENCGTLPSADVCEKCERYDSHGCIFMV